MANHHNASPGPNNSFCDVSGLLLGNAHNGAVKTGVSVVSSDKPFRASCHVMGGAPGTRETDLLAPEQTVEEIDAIVLSGGSAFGLEAANTVQNLLSAAGRGFQVAGATVPIVPSAILFDLNNGGDKAWGNTSPYPELAKAAYEDLSATSDVGAVGAGFGATTAVGPGGLGMASTLVFDDIIVSALVAVNAVGSPYFDGSNKFRAAPFELQDEFGGRDLPEQAVSHTLPPITKLSATGPGTSTTLAVVATNADLTKAELKRLAVMAHDGFALALWPAHTPFDGDIVFSISTAEKELSQSSIALVDLGAAASSTVARAIARGVFAAEPR